MSSADPADRARDDENGQLVRRTCAGDRAALAELLTRHLPRLRAFVRLRLGRGLRAKESGSDLVQSVCADFLAGLDRFEYRDEAQFRSWLFTAVVNKVRERERFYQRDRRDARREVAAAHSEDRPDGAGSFDFYADLITPSSHAIGREMAEQLERAFDELPESYREIITLSRIAGLSHEEAARELGRSVDSVRNLLHRALVRLAAILDRQGPASSEALP